MGCRGKAVWDCTGLKGRKDKKGESSARIEVEVGEERECSDLGRTECRGRRGRGVRCVQEGGCSVCLAMPCPVQPVLQAQYLEWDCGLRSLCILNMAAAASTWIFLVFYMCFHW